MFTFVLFTAYSRWTLVFTQIWQVVLQFWNCFRSEWYANSSFQTTFYSLFNIPLHFEDIFRHMKNWEKLNELRKIRLTSSRDRWICDRKLVLLSYELLEADIISLFHVPSEAICLRRWRVKYHEENLVTALSVGCDLFDTGYFFIYFLTNFRLEKKIRVQSTNLHWCNTMRSELWTFRTIFVAINRRFSRYGNKTTQLKRTTREKKRTNECNKVRTQNIQLRVHVDAFANKQGDEMWVYGYLWFQNSFKMRLLFDNSGSISPD